MIKLHSDEAKQKFAVLRPQLADTLAQLRNVLLAEVTSLVAEQVPMKVFDATVARKVSELILQRFDDFTMGLLQLDR